MNTDPKNNEQKADAHPEQLSPSTNHKRQQTRKAPGSVYDQITDRIITMLEGGTIPWHKPWNVKLAFPRNLITRKHYRGINVFLLLAMNYESPYWLTFKQTLELGGNVRKGEKSCPVVFWKHHEVEDADTGEKTNIPLLRFYHVFNIDQCEGLSRVPAPPAGVCTTLIRPAQIVGNMPQQPEIKHGMAGAFYSPSGDCIGMPHRERFQNEEEYFSTLFHELIHSTGHASRLNRSTLSEKTGFGSDSYCKEELIAEMGAAFLCGHAGILGRTIDNTAAYIKSWLEQLKNDRTLIVSSAAQAQKAVDFILGTKFEETPDGNQ